MVDLTKTKNKDLDLALKTFTERRKEFHVIFDDVKKKYGGGYSPKIIQEALARYSTKECIYDAKYIFPQIENINLLENKPSCEQKVFDKIADELSVSDLGASKILVSGERLKDVYDTLKKIDDPDCKRIAERFDDKGLLRSVCNNLANIIKLKDINKMCSVFLNNINQFSEISSLRAFTEWCDTAQRNAIFEGLDKEDVFKFYHDLISTHVRVPHYETLILSYIIVIDALDYAEIEPSVNKQQVRKLLLNIYDQIFREFKLRKRILEQIKTALTIYKSQKIDNNIIKELIEQYLIIYKNVLTNVRSESNESNKNKLINNEPRFSDWKEFAKMSYII